MNRLSTLEIAVRNERVEIEFYRGEAARTTSRAARALFEMLAAQEEHHIVLLEDLAGRLAGQGTWPASIEAGPLAASIDDVLDDLRRSLGDPDETAAAPDQVAALNEAIGFERRAEAFYSRLAAEATEAAETSFFGTLAGFERDHRGWIEAFLATLEEDSNG
jgi:rubrerythrin